MSVSVTNTDEQLSASTLLTEEDAATIEGLHTFDRDPNPPFAVSSGSAVVPNLDADKVDGYEAAALAVLAENETISGSWTFQGFETFSGSAGSNNVGVDISKTATMTANSNGAVLYVHGTMVEASSGTHAAVAGLRVDGPTITAGAASTTVAASLYLPTVPTGGTSNYCIYSDGPARLVSFVNEGVLRETAVISPTALTASVNDYAPTGISTARIVRLSADSAGPWTITGISAGQSTGRLLLLINVDTVDGIVIAHNSGSSSAANRIYTSTAANITLGPLESVELWYDAVDSVWRVIAWS